MSSSFSRLDPAIQAHLSYIRESAGLDPGNESLEALAAGWMEKDRAFQEQALSMGMENAQMCSDSERGFLALTYSGSLVAVGPRSGKTRRAVYVSIDRRRDVPARAESEDAVVQGEVCVGQEIQFSAGPVKRSSAVYRLALLPPMLALAEQNQRLDEATMALTKEFQAVDQTGAS